MSEGFTPRVNGALLPSFIGKHVSIAARVVEARPSQWIVESSDGKPFQVTGDASMPIVERGVYEVVGLVQADNVVQYEDHGVLSSTFDMENYNGLVALTHGTFAPIFGLPPAATKAA